MLEVFWAEGDACALLECAARLAWGWERLPPVERLPGGKPAFSGLPEKQFNLSHSGGLALCALSDGPVGADLELVRPRNPQLPARIFQGEDWARYQRLGGDWPAFYTLWTEVESVIKYTGEGLAAWRRAAVPEGCVLTGLSGPGWRGAVCAGEPFRGRIRKLGKD
ncbi:MAG: 4'-phosphopantetheinyl transferase superfamily protein [Oscillospiraceae bacterium]|nr:4'-phosphopantetheinyl transferase superfamily protein [Oscillospiraceae bacterium]